jgi:regulatory protein
MYEALEAARAVAFRYLGYAARSRAEIERRLTRDGFEPDVIATVADEMTAAGWLDDVKFAQDWVEDRADRKQYGRGRLAAELQRRGVDRETAASALNTIDEEAELRRARAATAHRWRPERFAALDSAGRQAEKRRCADFLQRRGFGWPIIVQVLAELMANEE